MNEIGTHLTPGKVAPAQTAAAVVRTWEDGRLSMPRVGWRGMVRLWWGKLRRQFQGRFMKGFIRRRHSLRRGECTRCGACCMLGIACPSLEFEGSGLASCRKYGPARNVACQAFPYTASDLRERDLILPGTPCGYCFPPGPARRAREGT